jgi:glutamate carboxypeptidase
MAIDDADLGLGRLRALAELELPMYLSELAALVGIDSGSYTKAGVDRVGSWVAGALRDLGAAVRVEPNPDLGDTVVGELRGGGRGRILVIGHLDTVFDPGTAAARPFRLAGGRAYGPGVCDMKAGLLSGIHALRALRASAPGEPQWLPCATLTFVANPDEEIGSPASTPIIRALAAQHDVALVLEAARANGDIVSARKGNLSVVLTLHGRSAHAGVEPEKGRSAILEAAHKIVALHALNGRWPGVTCNVGVVRGGTRANVVAEETALEVDLRSTTRADLDSAEAAVRQIAATTGVPDVTCDVEIRGRHWPMERLAATEALVGTAARIADGLGFALGDAATGGASDANTTAGEGVPSLDGLGPVGGLDHSPDEYIEVDSIVPRVALVAGLLRALGSGMVAGISLRDAEGGAR